MDTQDKDREELREQFEDIACEYGKPHENNCDLNQEDGAMNGCTCSVSRLLDELAKYAATQRKAAEIDGQLKALDTLERQHEWQSLHGFFKEIAEYKEELQAQLKTLTPSKEEK